MAAESLTTERMPVAQITINAGTQSRVTVCDQTIANYAEAYEEGQKFPPVVVFFDGTTHYLADGFHRMLALIQSGEKWVDAEIHAGSLADAVAYAAGANDDHGLPRTRDDKIKSLRMLWEQPENSQKPMDWFASTAKVSHHLASKAVRQFSEESGESLRKTVISKDGRERSAVSKPAANPFPARETESADTETVPPPPLIDRVDRVVPEIFHSHFVTAKTIHGIALKIGEVKSLLNRLRGIAGAEKVDFAGIERLLNQAQQALDQSRYHTECPTCHKSPEPGCKLCGERGWITEKGWKRLSDEQQATMRPKMPF